MYLHGKPILAFTDDDFEDLEMWGAIWVDEEVVVDRNIVSGRRPPDLPAFTLAFVKLLAEQA